MYRTTPSTHPAVGRVSDRVSTPSSRVRNALRRSVKAMLLPIVALVWPAFAVAHPAPILADARVEAVDFRGEAVSDDARRVADWIVGAGDNHGLPFIIVDKVAAKVFVFEAGGRLRAATRALLGSARGDDSAPGVGDRPVASIPLRERTTPAGRFVAGFGPGTRGDVLWVDYADAIALHRVVRGAARDHRLDRLATASSADKRISYGCINVPVSFYDTVVVSALGAGGGIVYILPEVKSLAQVFGIGVGGGVNAQ